MGVGFMVLLEVNGSGRTPGSLSRTYVVR